MPFFVLLTNMDKCRWSFLKFAYFLNIPFSKIYRKITKISLGAYIFQRPFFGGAYIRRGLNTEGTLRFKIG